VIGERIDQVRACYNGALDGWPKLAGQQVVRFAIAADGTMVDASPVEPELGPGGLACCIIEALNPLRFPAAEDGHLVVFLYPFLLQKTAQ
jgi:hypothetical protein